MPAAVARCARDLQLKQPLQISASFDLAALEEINERWKALGIPLLQRGARPSVRILHAPMTAQTYRLQVNANGVTIIAGDADGAFYGAMTLAQLPQRAGGAWTLPCVAISDAPALRWRILSDDVSRGPLPNMRYFKER